MTIAVLPSLHTRLIAACPALLDLLTSGTPFRSEAVFEAVAQSVGGSLANNDFTARDAYDAMEYALNRGLREGVFGPIFAANDAELALLVGRLEALVSRLPSQTRRTQEQQEYQQFSTPPTLAAAMAYAAAIRPGDTVLDPSAGVGSLLTFAHAAGGRPVANELAPRRAALLRALGIDAVTVENAEYIDAVLPAQSLPDVVIMNPPFSATAGRREGFRNWQVGARHVHRAAACLPEGGRLVALVGHTLDTQSAAFTSPLRRGPFRVTADVSLSGTFYKAFGTTFDNRMLVIDRVAGAGETFRECVGTLGELVTVAAHLRGTAPERRARVEALQFGLMFDLPPADAAAPPSAVMPVLLAPSRPVNDGTAGPEVQARTSRRAVTVPAGPPSMTFAPGSYAPLDLTILDDAGRAAFDGDGVFESYAPQRFAITGAQPHPDKLVESAAMAAVLPPVPTYRPTLPTQLVTEGMLSLPQLEAVVYAGHCHAQRLPSGERRGFFIGDGTGVGKGREISGIILDNWLQGRRRAVWVSEKPDLLSDARRDFASIQCEPLLIQAQSQFRQNASITLGDEAVLFTTYATLRQGAKQATGTDGQASEVQSRLDQLIDWLGDDFDGVIVFDESHAGGNAVTSRCERGTKQASRQAQAMLDLQKALPHARVVYVSATGATEVHNLAYASRLGLWGEGTAFQSVHNFIAQVANHGLAIAEIIARDMKALGVYLARSLSYQDVSYSRCEQVLSPEQVAIYNRLAEAWQMVLNNVNDALDATDGGKCANTKSAALSAFWGANQRFFNQILVSLQMPAVLDQIDEDLAQGKSVVLQLVNTFEAVQARALARATTQEELDELDITPRDALIQYVENSFPVFEHETYTDEDGNLRSRIVRDSADNPVRSPDALAMRDALLSDLQAIQVPDSPLDIILGVYGPDAVAEVTGRSRRAVRELDNKTGEVHVKLQARSRAKAQAEAAEFMSGKRRILMFSDAGGTGFSFHAARDCENQQQRAHYLVQAGWRANKAVQGFGRTHRTNQVSAPHYRLCTTDLPGHRRFLSSIARRLDGLGALTKGHRDTANQGLFSAQDNLESVYAGDAINQLFRTLYLAGPQGIDGLHFDSLTAEMGLNLIGDGGLLSTKLPSVPQFLNRLLSLTVERQRQVFDAFIERMEAAIERARQAGELDLGMEDIRAESIEFLSMETVRTDPRSGASTQAVSLLATYPVSYRDFPEWSAIVGYVRNRRSGYVWAVRDMPPRTDRGARLIQQVRLIGVCSESVRDKHELNAQFCVIDRDLARELWTQQSQAMPKQRSEQLLLLTGLLLNVWDQLPFFKHVRRAHTTDGRRFLGCLIPEDQARETLTALGASTEAIDVDHLHTQILRQGQTAILANQWVVTAATVAGETRIEVKVPTHDQPRQVRAAAALGAFLETHQYRTRAFLPVDCVDALRRLIDTHPVTRVTGVEDLDAAA